MLGPIVSMLGPTVIGAAKDAFFPDSGGTASGGSGGGGGASAKAMSHAAANRQIIQDKLNKHAAKAPDSPQAGFVGRQGGNASSGGRALRSVTASDLHPISGTFIQRFAKAAAASEKVSRKAEDVA